MDVYNRIKFLREQKNMTQKELAEKTGYKTRSAINKIEKGLRDINQSQIKAFADALGVTPAYLMGWEKENLISSSADFSQTMDYKAKGSKIPNPYIEKYFKLDDISKDIVNFVIDKELERQQQVIKGESAKYDTQQIAYFDGPVSAGLGSLALDNPPSKMLDIPTYIKEYFKANYAVDMRGDSMEPTFLDGSVLLVQITDQIQPGQIGIFYVDGEFFCKELGHDELISHNKKYPPIKLTEDSKCMGRVVGTYWEFK